METHTSMSPVLHQLIRAIHGAVHDEHAVAHAATKVAMVLRPFLGHPDLLQPAQCAADPTHYMQHLLYVADGGQFSVVALVWLPGQATAIHDHVSWCVVGVHQGQEQEVQYRVVADAPSPYLTPLRTSRNDVGSVEALTPPGDIHQVVNPGPQRAISLHVYGADIRQLGSSIHHRYDYVVQPVPPMPVS